MGAVLLAFLKYLCFPGPRLGLRRRIGAVRRIELCLREYESSYHEPRHRHLVSGFRDVATLKNSEEPMKALWIAKCAMHQLATFISLSTD